MYILCAFLRGQNPDVFKFDEFLNFALPLLLVKVFAAFCEKKSSEI